MNRELLTEQVGIIRQTFGYVREFQDKIFVIKIDSSLRNSAYFPILIRDVVLLHKSGIKVVLIPGTQLRINEILSHFNIEYQLIDGIRVSTEEAIPFIKMAAFDVSNNLMTLLAENSANAVIGNWVRARSIGVKDGIDYQSTGTIDKIDSQSIISVLNDNMIPIFPNIGWSLSGKPYNISSNEVALRISSELKAEKLFFITENGGIETKNYTLPNNVPLLDDDIISKLSIGKAQEFLALNPGNIYTDINLQLLSLSCQAVENGVNRVHIIDGTTDGVLLKEIFSNIGMGTMIHRDQHENIRQTVHHDIPDIMRITEPLIEKQILIHRSGEQIEEELSNYVVYEVDGTIHGCGALKEYEGSFAEIYSIAVDKSYASMGTGRNIISFLAIEAQKRNIEKLFLLTTQTTDWFISQGFSEVSVDLLPREKAVTYNWERKSRVLMLNLKENNQAAILQ